MYERIVEIIVYVISELRMKQDINKVNLEALVSQGYTDTEISTALSWIVDKIEVNERLLPFSSSSATDSFRILHDGEKELFTPEAWGELVAMSSLGIISNENIEMLIDRALLIGLKRIDLTQLKMFVANFIFNIQYNNMAGSRFMLQGNETIN